ncbi:unnamed protein product, partial [marine sediment metagenome]
AKRCPSGTRRVGGKCVRKTKKKKEFVFDMDDYHKHIMKQVKGKPMMPKEKVEWVKIKHGKITKIREPKSIDKLLDEGYTVSKSTEIGNNTAIMTYSPLTRQQHWELRKKQLKAVGLMA